LDLDQLKQILTLVREHELTELEIEQNGLRVKIRKDGAGVHAGTGAAGGHLAAPHGPTAAITGPTSAPATVAQTAAANAAAAAAAQAADDEIELAVVKSPIVGTFYRSPEPGAEPFVEVGTMIKKGQVLCVIEAMKLMNEIDAECDGEVVNVYVENGQPVQYGERLFAIRAK
jgi:acetyl-CoA carboxylase biotin carboxyl carrier protein